MVRDNVNNHKIDTVLGLNIQIIVSKVTAVLPDQAIRLFQSRHKLLSWRMLGGRMNQIKNNLFGPPYATQKRAKVFCNVFSV